MIYIYIMQVTHVFVYDFPYCIEEYVHRIGRTARGVDGRGEAYSNNCLLTLSNCLCQHVWF